VCVRVCPGNGLFTSSTRDHDWQVAHGLLPRGFNQIRIKNYYGVSLHGRYRFDTHPYCYVDCCCYCCCCCCSCDPRSKRWTTGSPSPYLLNT